MSFDPLHNQYDPNYFDSHSLQVDEEIKSISLLPASGPISFEDADKCIRIWNSIMADPSLDHALQSNLTSNITSLQSWMEMNYEKAIKAALDSKNYKTIVYLWKRQANNITFSWEHTIISLFEQKEVDSYLLDEALKLAGKIDIIRCTDYLFDKSESHRETRARVFQFALSHKYYTPASLNHALYLSIHNEETTVTKMLLSYNATLEPLQVSELLMQLYTPDHRLATAQFTLLNEAHPLGKEQLLHAFHLAILSSNSALKEVILPLIDFSIEELKEVWTYVLFTQDFDFAFAKLPPFPSMLEFGVEALDTNFVERVLKTGKCSKEEIARSYQLALASGKVEIMRLLEKNDKVIIADILQKWTPEKDPLYFHQLLFVSREGLPFLDLIKEEHPSIAEIQADYWNWAPYVGRFKPSNMDQIKKSYAHEGGENSSFIAKQMNYGHAMCALTKEAAASRPSTLKEMILGIYAKKRAEIAQNPAYAQERDEGAKTPMNGVSNDVRKELSHRYAIYQNLAMKTWRENPTLSQSDKFIAYALSYKGCTLTRCGRREDNGEWTWVHTFPEVIKELWPRMEELHQEILSMDASPLQPFQDKLAEGYWLGCHLMITKRGNSQYFLNWLCDMCISKGFLPPIASDKYPLIDCVALCVPLEEFKQNFRSYFDSLFVPV